MPSSLRSRRVGLPLLVLACGSAVVAWAQMGNQPGQPAAQPAQPTQPQGQPQARPGAGMPSPDMMGSMLVNALKNSPGCLGADSARLASGKFAIFGFFENKAAAMNWYNNPLHARMRQSAGAPAAQDGAKREPMADVPDGVPVMAVAILVPPSMDANAEGGKPASPPASPIGSLSIELFTPLSGGLQLGDAEFAPAAFRGLTKIKAAADNASAEGAKDSGEAK